MNHMLEVLRAPDSRSGRSSWRRAVSIAVLQTALASGVAAAPAVQQGQVGPPHTEHHVGKFVFVELVTPDLVGAKRFYGELFGWHFRDVQLDDGTAYTEASRNGRAVAGMAQERPGRLNLVRQPGWLGFIAVNDVAETRRAALFNGAKLLDASHALPDHDQAAVFADPQGAAFGVLASSTGDSIDVLAGPGEWVWRSLLTNDPAVDTAFYQKVFDYEVFELPAEGTQQHVILATDDYARASASTVPQITAPAPCRWLNYVRVDDLGKSIALAVALGAKVLVSPTLDRQGGEVAVVADPQGVPVGLLEWPDTDSRGASQ